jgi:hypothetical protein
VLIVHGNHEMPAPSEAGYAYLGEHLASRGMIAVSVDENFLNGTWTDLLPFGEQQRPEGGERRARLAAAGAPAAVARVDRGPRQPRSAAKWTSTGWRSSATRAGVRRRPSPRPSTGCRTIPTTRCARFDYHFGIRAVVAIAQVDGQYEPGGRPTPLAGVSYLALQGAYDGDITYFDGISPVQPRRPRRRPDRFKAAVYVDQANHGQFNTEWGRTDRSDFPSPGLLNLGAIMEGERSAPSPPSSSPPSSKPPSTGYDAYRSLFQQPGAAAPWLPEVAYRTRYDDAHTAPAGDLRRRPGRAHGDRPGRDPGAPAASAGWKGDMAPLKSGDQGSAALWLRWDGGGQYTLSLAARRRPRRPATRWRWPWPRRQRQGTPLDFTVLLVDAPVATAHPAPQRGRPAAAANPLHPLETRPPRQPRPRRRAHLPELLAPPRPV